MFPGPGAGREIMAKGKMKKKLDHVALYWWRSQWEKKPKKETEKTSYGTYQVSFAWLKLELLISWDLVD